MERFNGTLVQRLAALCQENSTEWDIKLPYVVSAYNKTPNTMTGYSPHEIIFGNTPKTPIDISLNYSPTHHERGGKEFDLGHYVDQHNTIISNIGSRSKEIQSEKITHQRENLELKKHSKLPIIGSKVGINTRTNDKLGRKYQGPYEVLSTKPNYVQIELNSNPTWIHISNIKEFSPEQRDSVS